MPLHDEYLQNYLSELTHLFTEETSRKEDLLPCLLGRFHQKLFTEGFTSPYYQLSKGRPLRLSLLPLHFH